MSPLRTLCVALVLLPAQALAASPWQYIVASPDGLVTFYGDPKSLVVRGPVRRLRLLYDYKQVQQDPDTLVRSHSQTVQVSVNCVEIKIGMGQEIKYADNMMQGAVVEKSPPPSDVDYRDVAPGSINAKVLQYACAIKRGKAAK